MGCYSWICAGKMLFWVEVGHLMHCGCQIGGGSRWAIGGWLDRGRRRWSIWVVAGGRLEAVSGRRRASLLMVSAAEANEAAGASPPDLRIRRKGLDRSRGRRRMDGGIGAGLMLAAGRHRVEGAGLLQKTEMELDGGACEACECCWWAWRLGGCGRKWVPSDLSSPVLEGRLDRADLARKMMMELDESSFAGGRIWLEGASDGLREAVGRGRRCEGVGAEDGLLARRMHRCRTATVGGAREDDDGAPYWCSVFRQGIVNSVPADVYFVF
ncbi:hypothetical protein ACLOJK_039337 [Asimina triloba]